MSQFVHGETAEALTERGAFLRRALFRDAARLVRIWINRRKQRQELLGYMATDHRAPTDIGVAANDARDWAGRPFWHE